MNEAKLSIVLPLMAAWINTYIGSEYWNYHISGMNGYQHFYTVCCWVLKLYKSRIHKPASLRGCPPQVLARVTIAVIAIKLRCSFYLCYNDRKVHGRGSSIHGLRFICRTFLFNDKFSPAKLKIHHTHYIHKMRVGI